MAGAPSRLSRFFSPVFLALQILVWSAAPILDARAEARSSRAFAHVEEVGGGACPRVHSPSECQTCRTLGAGALSASLGSSSVLPVRAGSQFLRTAVELSLVGLFGPLGSRAPPAL